MKLIDKRDWAYYKRGLVSMAPPYRNIIVDAKTLFKTYKNAFYIRWDSDFDKSDSKNYWHVIKDGEFVLDSLPGKSRNAIRKCLKNCEIKQVDCRYIIENGGYDVYVSEYVRYQRKGHPSPVKSLETWSEGMRQAEANGQEFWGGVYENKIIAYSICLKKEKHVDLVTWKVDYERYNLLYPSYGLVYKMCEYYLNQESVLYVSDGGRSLTQHSNVQNFLIDKFRFRKAYTKLNVAFRWYLIMPLILLSLCDDFIKSNKIRSLVRLYKWSR